MHATRPHTHTDKMNGSRGRTLELISGFYIHMYMCTCIHIDTCMCSPSPNTFPPEECTSASKRGGTCHKVRQVDIQLEASLGNLERPRVKTKQKRKKATTPRAFVRLDHQGLSVVAASASVVIFLATDYTHLSLSDPLPLILFTLAEVTCHLP